jgi:hypothetical protein
MSPLEETIQEVQALKRKGYDTEEITAAALVMIAGAAVVMMTPRVEISDQPPGGIIHADD